MRCSQEELETLIRTFALVESSYELAERTGWSQTTVARLAKRLGCRFARGKATPWSEEERATAFRLKSEGRTIREVADLLGRSLSSVRSYFIYVNERNRRAAVLAEAAKTPGPTPEELLAEHKEWLAKVRAQRQWRQRQCTVVARL